MSSCEKCWSDAGEVVREYGGDKVKRYAELMQERKATPCTPEEQAGPHAKICPACKRRTVHQVTGECMSCHVEIELTTKNAAPDLYARVAAHADRCGACGGTGTPNRMSAMDDSRAPDGSCSVCYEDRATLAKARGESR